MADPTLPRMAREPHRTSEILDAVALLVVDMQESFLKAVDDAQAVVERCAFAIEAARTVGIKVLFTEQVPEKLGPTDPRLLALAGGNGRVFAKSAFSALQANGLQDQLRRLGVYHLLLVGIETPVCIYQTALHANDSDFDVTVLSDCVSGRRADDCRIVLTALAQANCHVLPSETVFYSMLGHAGHPRFGSYTKLVKRYSSPDPLNQPRESEVEAPQAGPAAEAAADRKAPEADTAAHETDQGQGESREERRGRRRRGRRGRGRDRDRGPSTEAAGTDETGPESAEEEFEAPTKEPMVPAPEETPALASENADEPAGPAEVDASGTVDSTDAEGAPKKRPRRRRGGARRRRGRDAAEGESAEAPSGGDAPESPEGSPSAAPADTGSSSEPPAAEPPPAPSPVSDAPAS